MSGTKRVLILPGDGIGPEVVRQGVRVLQAAADKFGLNVEISEALIGGCAIDATGNPLPPETLEAARAADAVLLGAVGGSKWDTTDPNAPRPEQGLLGIRKGLNLFANIRPVELYDVLIDASTLRPDSVRGTDMVVVRELTGGIYFGESGRSEDGNMAYDTCMYTREEVERVTRAAFDLARGRRSLVHSVDKANVLESSRLWREIVIEIAREYPDVRLEHMLVDNAAMQLIRQPTQFDVMLTENLFGDILSDEASMLTGSIGMLPSASLTSQTKGASTRVGLYEPIHGSAPGLAGADVANPIATILSVAMMFRYSLDHNEAAEAIENAVEQVIAKGYRTPDIMPGQIKCGTRVMGEAIVKQLSA